VESQLKVEPYIICAILGRNFVRIWVVLCLWVVALGGSAAAEAGFVSLDMCADEYALGLLPPEAIVAVSPRAGLKESFYATRAASHRRVRPSLETLLSLRPKAVIRTWGGDISLINALSARGIKIIQINDVNNFAQARDEVLRVGALLGVSDKAQVEAKAMDEALKTLNSPGRGRSALYYTPSGYTAGHETWAGHVVETLGFKLMSKSPYFDYISPEAFLGLRPDVYAIGFYDDAYGARHAPGRHPLVRERLSRSVTLTLPSTVLACSGWFGAYGLQAMTIKP
jgi:iron complex transport system substrate-binding protein